MYYITIYRENTIYIAIYIETNLRAKRKEEERFSYIEKYNKIYIEKTTNYLWGKRKEEKRYILIYIEIHRDKCYIYRKKYNLYIRKTHKAFWGKKKREKRYISKYIIVYLYFPYRKIYISNIKQE